VIIREECPSDIPGIREIHRAVFGRDAEGELVDRLRTEGLSVASMVADDGGSSIGHALFSELRIKTSGSLIPAVALAPVGVVPRRQREGIGTELISFGLRACREIGISAVLVLGDPRYYARFGFCAALTSKLEGPFTGRHWMAVELLDGCLSNVTGSVEYPVAFTLVD
jgi:putative acetyltransferase